MRWLAAIRPIPGLELPKTDIPLHNLSLGPHDRLGKKRLERERLRRAEQEEAETEVGAAKGKDSKGKGKGKMTVEEAVKRGVEVDDAEYEKQLSRKEKLAVSHCISRWQVSRHLLNVGHVCFCQSRHSFRLERPPPKRGPRCLRYPRRCYPR
jgi:hypothetical protein